MYNDDDGIIEVAGGGGPSNPSWTYYNTWTNSSSNMTTDTSGGLIKKSISNALTVQGDASVDLYLINDGTTPLPTGTYLGSLGRFVSTGSFGNATSGFVVVLTIQVELRLITQDFDPSLITSVSDVLALSSDQLFIGNFEIEDGGTGGALMTATQGESYQYINDYPNTTGDYYGVYRRTRISTWREGGTTNPSISVTLDIDYGQNLIRAI